MVTNIQEEPARCKIVDEIASLSNMLVPPYPTSRCHIPHTIISTLVITTLSTESFCFYLNTSLHIDYTNKWHVLFMVAPCINNIIYFIVQLMYSIV